MATTAFDKYASLIFKFPLINPSPFGLRIYQHHTLLMRVIYSSDAPSYVCSVYGLDITCIYICKHIQQTSVVFMLRIQWANNYQTELGTSIIIVPPNKTFYYFRELFIQS